MAFSNAASTAQSPMTTPRTVCPPASTHPSRAVRTVVTVVVADEVTDVVIDDVAVEVTDEDTVVEAVEDKLDVALEVTLVVAVELTEVVALDVTEVVTVVVADVISQLTKVPASKRRTISEKSPATSEQFATSARRKPPAEHTAEPFT